MRIRIVQKPTEVSIDGIQLDRFQVGVRYEVGTIVGTLMLAEGWAEPVVDDVPAVIEAPPSHPVPNREPERPVTADSEDPPNLRREIYPPDFPALSEYLAADLKRHRPEWPAPAGKNAEPQAPPNTDSRRHQR